MARTGDQLLEMIRNGEKMTWQQQLRLTLSLSVPAILAQLSSVVMEYIDASMVGHLGAFEAASVGLVATTIWLFGGLCSVLATGFSVQVAHLIGANDEAGARSVVRQSLVVALLWGLTIGTIGLCISSFLPQWLGGGEEIAPDATKYFGIFSLFVPLLTLHFLAGSMLRCSGDMRTPSALNVLMCVLDVVFNFIFIFPARDVVFCGFNIHIPGFNLGVEGAAWGTGAAEAITASLMVYILCFRNKNLRLGIDSGSFRPTLPCIKKAFHIGGPMGLERIVLNGAHIASTMIVAPLGAIAIATNSLAVIAEGMCYMPGFGIGEAATTLVGQSIGAVRAALARSFARIAIALGMAVMALMGVVLYVGAPTIMTIMTIDPDIRALGIEVLRIEAFAEPMFAASIVAYSVFVGAGDTLKPCMMNLISMWGVRIMGALILAPVLGLKGVWIAMCLELCFRGAIFLLRVKFGHWIKFSNDK